jgi:hypothetical protein
MHKSATKCNETIGKWCKNKHRASKIIDTFETYHTTEGGAVGCGAMLPGAARVCATSGAAGLGIFSPEIFMNITSNPCSPNFKNPTK